MLSPQRKNLDTLILPGDQRPSLTAVHCMNPHCGSRFSDTYYVDSLNAPCPRCGEKRFLYPCNSVHLIQETLTGPLFSKITGKRYHFVCDLARRAWNYGIKHGGFPMHHTQEPAAANCSDCLRLSGHVLDSNNQFRIGADPATLVAAALGR